jgi:thiamine biosynthesis lipoprotein
VADRGTGLRHVEPVMGTVVSFDVRGDGARVRRAVEAAVALLHHADEVFSTYRPDSQVNRLAAGTLALADCSPEVREVAELCEAAERRSGGAFSARYAGRFDPTGLVKGWAVERAAAVVHAAGADVCVNGGGDVQVRGGSWRVGVSDPLRRGRLAAVVPVEGAAGVATSGPAERGCHIIDPRTGRPPRTALASVTVIRRGLTDADADATAAFALGSGAHAYLRSLPAAAALTISTTGTTWRTP